MGKKQEFFDWKAPRVKVDWLVKGLIPQGKLSFIVAQAGVGKSFWVEALAASIVYGQPFLGFDTVQGDVLVIDEDTPTDTLHDRFGKFGNYFKGSPTVGTLFLRSMEGLTFSSGLIQEITAHPTVKVVIIDSLTTCAQGLELNSGSDMSILAKLKSECLHPNRAIVITHHISEKKELSAQELMICDPHSLTMYSSVINQQADSIYIVGSPDTDGILKKLYVRPVSKRVTIQQKPFICHLQENHDFLYFNGLEPFRPEGAVILSEVEKDIYKLFQEVREPLNVRQVDERMGGVYAQGTIRTGLNLLHGKNMLYLTREAHNLFKYSLEPDSTKPSLEAEPTQTNSS